MYTTHMCNPTVQEQVPFGSHVFTVHLLSTPPAANFAISRVLRRSDGDATALSSFQGKQPVVLFFYPKQGTPGCTKVRLCAPICAVSSV
eukprot:1144642-Pelagomonas_calceolata.AAC.2